MTFPGGQFPVADGTGGGAMAGYQQQQQAQQQQQQQQQMIQMAAQQAQLKQQMVGGQPMSPQQAQLMMQQQHPGTQSPLHQVRSPPTLPSTVRSPQPVPSPRQHTPNMVPSPRAPISHPCPSPQLGQHSPRPSVGGGNPQVSSDPNTMNSEQVMLPQINPSHATNPDFVTSLNQQQQQEDLTPLTPQDQLSRFVDNL